MDSSAKMVFLFLTLHGLSLFYYQIYHIFGGKSGKTMDSIPITGEELWAKQNLLPSDVDYTILERDKMMLHQLSKFSWNCTFVVDVYKCRYAFASSNCYRPKNEISKLEKRNGEV